MGMKSGHRGPQAQDLQSYHTVGSFSDCHFYPSPDPSEEFLLSTSLLERVAASHPPPSSLDKINAIDSYFSRLITLIMFSLRSVNTDVLA